MPDYWVGVPGHLTAERQQALIDAGINLSDVREYVSSGHGPPPTSKPERTTLRTFVRISDDDEDAAAARVATALDIGAGGLLVRSTDFLD